MSDRTGYVHLQFSGVIPQHLADKAMDLLRSAMCERPADCGGVMTCCKPDERSGEIDYDDPEISHWPTNWK